MKALIVYHSKTGHTRQAADDICRGLADRQVDCTVKKATEIGAGTLDDYDIVLFGTPTYGQRRYAEPARQVAALIDSAGAGRLKGKVSGAFAVNAAYGGNKLVAAMEAKLEGLGAKVVRGGPVVKAGAPLSLWKGPDASQADVRTCEEFGGRVADAAGA